MHPRRWLVVVLVAASALFAGCEQAQSVRTEKPAEVVPIQGTDLSRVVLTDEAAQRIGIKTAPVQQLAASAGAPGTAIPLAAVIYQADGSTWVYTASAPLTFVRQRVTVARVSGDLALLQTGPAPGTAVVTVGAAELFGSEYGVEGE